MSTLLFASLVFGFVVPLCIGFALPASLAVIVGGASAWIGGLALLAVCGVVLTGPVYLAKVDDKGALKTWGVGNKVVAVLLLGYWVYATVRHFVH